MPGLSDLVINTGPVLALAAAGHLQTLRELFTKATVPYEVVQEIEAGGRTQFAREEFRAASWLDKRSASISHLAFLSARSNKELKSHCELRLRACANTGFG